MSEFRNLGLSKEILEVLEEMNFDVPTDIQKESIPLILKGKDVIGNAATGSGKTLAFASGIIEKCVAGEGVQALVMAPTRELAEQIAKVMRIFSKKTSLNVQEVYGGVPIERQFRAVQYCDVVVGTPGRILDHLKRRSLDLAKLKILVLDEADRMVDMGFLPDVERIINLCPTRRQTLLFSATTSKDVEYIEKKYMQFPKTVAVETYVDVSQLQQYYYNAPSHIKFSLLVHFLKNEKSGIIMVFCNTRRNVDLVTMNLKRHGINAQAIHGGLEQKKRSRIIDSLHKNEADILVCTDVAARGLDIKNVTHVYNYDVPRTSEEYVHRVGRTARAGKKGIAISIVSSNDYENFSNVLMDDSIKIEEKPIPEVEKVEAFFKNARPRDMEFRGRGRGYGGRERRDSGRGERRDSGRRGSGGGRGGSGRFGKSGRSDGRRDSRESRGRGGRGFSRGRY